MLHGTSKGRSGLESEHDPRALPARGHGPKRPQRLGRPRSQQELHIVKAAATDTITPVALLIHRRCKLTRHIQALQSPGSEIFQQYAGQLRWAYV